MVETRRAGVDDAAELLRLRTVMMTPLHPAGAAPPDWAVTGIPTLQRMLTDPADMLAAFVVDRPDGTGLAACVVGAIDQRLPGPRDPTGLRGYIYNVVTDPGHRRRGYSRACMTALLDWYAQRGISAVDLRASEQGEPLYASLGFHRSGDPGMRLRVADRISPAR